MGKKETEGTRPVVELADTIRRQEFLDLIGDPAKVAQELEEARERLKDYDPSPCVTLILNTDTLI